MTILHRQEALLTFIILAGYQFCKGYPKPLARIRLVPLFFRRKREISALFFLGPADGYIDVCLLFPANYSHGEHTPHVIDVGHFFPSLTGLANR